MRSHRLVPVLLLLGAVSASFFLASCGAAPDEAAITEKVVERFRQELGPAAVRIGTVPHTLEILDQGGKISVVVRLTDLFKECAVRPEQCDAATEKMVRSVSQWSEWVPSRESLRATLRDRAWLAGMAQSGVKAIARPFVGDLLQVFVFDMPESMLVVSTENLAKFKMSEDELAAVALANLERTVTDFAHRPLSAGSPIRVLNAGDSYEASRLLLHDRWRALAGEVKGNLLACAPSRDYVYFVGSGESVETLQEFRQLVEERARVESHALTPVVLRWKPEGWVADGG